MKIASPGIAMDPVIRRETILLNAVADGYRGRNGKWVDAGVAPASTVEKEAKNIVADILKK